MAKISFSKLGLKVNQDIKNIEYNGQVIEVKQYLPINEKLDLMGRVINLAADENNFANPVKLNVCKALEIIYAYTNINITDKQKEDTVKMYDLVTSSGLYDAIEKAIPESEIKTLTTGIAEIVSNMYQYKNSALGIMDAIANDYSNLNFDATNIQSALADPDNMSLLKSVLENLG